MVRTIQVSNHVLIQGDFVRALGGGLIVVRVGGQTFTGRPVNS